MTAQSIASREARSCPAAFYGKLREGQPVYLDPVVGCHVVTRFADIVFIGDHPELFSNNNEILVGRSHSPVADEVKRRFEQNGFPELHTLVTADPPDHTRYRSAVDRIFTPSFVKAFEPRIREIASELTDAFADRGSVDLLNEFAIPLPMYIILDRLGLPRADSARVKHWSDVSVARADPTMTPERELALTDSFIEMQNYLHGHLERCRVAPDDSLLSAIANLTDADGVPLRAGECVSIAFQVMVAGNETTTTVMLSALMRILTEPGLYAAASADPAILPGLIEEVLRMDTPVPVFYRTAKQNVTIGDVAIPAGGLIAISYIGANHDPRKWPDADRFDPCRKGGRQHLGFGRGPHFCIGHLLAKAELRIAIAMLLERLPGLALSSDHAVPAFADHPFVHSLDAMHLTFVPTHTPTNI